MSIYSESAFSSSSSSSSSRTSMQRFVVQVTHAMSGLGDRVEDVELGCAIVRPDRRQTRQSHLAVVVDVDVDRYTVHLIELHTHTYARTCDQCDKLAVVFPGFKLSCLQKNPRTFP